MVSRASTYLDAASLDPLAADLVARGASLRVHSVFQRALNLVATDGELLGLVGPNAGNGPSTIVLRSIPSPGLDHQGLSPGDAAGLDGPELRISGTIAVRLLAANRWRAVETRLGVQPEVALNRVARADLIAQAAGPTGGLALLLPCLASMGEIAGEPPGNLDPVCRVAWMGARSLVLAWRRSDAHEVERAAERLAGLGPGLTPSGDDLLTGFLIGASRAGGARPELAEACARAAHGRTTDIAFARVRHAAQGAIEEVQEDVMTTLLGPDDGDLPAVVARAARWGHTSGIDTLVGIFLGARVALSGERPEHPSEAADGSTPSKQAVLGARWRNV